MRTENKAKCCKCEEIMDINSLKSVTLYGGEEITICQDCLATHYTGCADCGVFFADNSREEMDLLILDRNVGDTVCIFCHPQVFIDACENLNDLCKTLNLISAVTDSDNKVDFCDLPTYGIAPENTSEIFSWNDEYFLVQASECGKWELQERV